MDPYPQQQQQQQQRRAPPPQGDMTGAAGPPQGGGGGSGGGRLPPSHQPHRSSSSSGRPSRAGTHLVKVSGTVFELDKKYSFIRPIGSGAYGVVISAVNSESEQKVAIKKIPRAFDDLVDAKRILREIKLLRHFQHENIISLVDLLPPPSLDGFEDVYIVSDLMETDLHRIIYSKQPLSIDHIQYFIYQALRALKYMHSAGVLHRDLKPSNLLLNSNCDLKVCDFGLARGLVPPQGGGMGEDDDQGGGDGGHNKPLTEYVVTRWYRAPEIMLACQDYTRAIDIWSMGCIFGELLARQPMFPGNDYIDQLRLICAKLGQPPEEDLQHVSSARAKRFILGLPASPPANYAAIFPDKDPRALDLLDRMLQFNPNKRITAVEALRHPFMESLHNEDDEPVCDRPFGFDHENESLKEKRRLQYLILLEVLSFHPEASAALRPEHPPPPISLVPTPPPPSFPMAPPPPNTTAPPPPPHYHQHHHHQQAPPAGAFHQPSAIPFHAQQGGAGSSSVSSSRSMMMDISGSTPVHGGQRERQQQQLMDMMNRIAEGNAAAAAASSNNSSSNSNPYSTQALQQQQQQYAGQSSDSGMAF